MRAQTVRGRFRIEESIGQGGMGEVFRAWDTVLARPVALKWLLPDRRGDASATGRFLREARATARLRHPNIVTIYDLGEEDGAAYIVMDLYEGRSLREFIGDASVAPGRRVGWLRAIASALATAHEAQLVHRDVKPSNVLVCDDGEVKVLDFGLVKRTGLEPLQPRRPETSPVPSFRTEDGVVVGTPAYMSPEQSRGDGVDPRSDQYSWGVVGYELILGRRWSPTMRDEVAPASLAPVLSVLHQATAPEPSARFPSMRSVLEALDGLEGLGATTGAPGPGDRSRSDAETVDGRSDARPVTAPMRAHAPGSSSRPSEPAPSTGPSRVVASSPWGSLNPPYPPSVPAPATGASSWRPPGPSYPPSVPAPATGSSSWRPPGPSYPPSVPAPATGASSWRRPGPSYPASVPPPATGSSPWRGTMPVASVEARGQRRGLVVSLVVVGVLACAALTAAVVYVAHRPPNTDATPTPGVPSSVSAPQTTKVIPAMPSAPRTPAP